MIGLPVLAGEKVVLRALEPSRERARSHMRWRNDPDVMRWHYLRPSTDLAEERERIRRLLESPVDWAWDIFALVDDGRFAHTGYVLLHKGGEWHRHGELAITIGERRAWGRGIGREVLALVLDHAFSREGGLHKVYLNVAALNERAIRCYRAVGFVEEGRRREHLNVDGQWVDDLVMSLLDREWLARRLSGRRSPEPEAATSRGGDRE